MRVADGFQTSQHLQILPSDFKVIKVSTDSLKDNTLRRLCRDIERQHQLEEVTLSDRVSYEERLTQVLTDGLWETSDLDKSLLVLGNKTGLLSGRFFNQTDYDKLIVDHTQFGDKYPIFLDTSTVKELDTGRSSSAIKREREQTFTEAPEPQRQRAETFSDLKTAWMFQAQDYQRQIDILKKQKHDVMEQNLELAEQASGNQQALENQIAELKSQTGNQRALENQIAELKSQIRELEVTRMEEDDENDSPLEVVNEKMVEIQDSKSRPAHIMVMGMSESIMQHDGDDGEKLAYAAELVDDLEKKNNIYANKWTLNQVGMTPWNPSTTPFLDYLISFRSVMAVSKLPDSKMIQLLFSALPSKYSYLRGIVNRHPDFNSDNYLKTEKLLIKMIVGGQEKIFTDFVSLQRKSHESLLEYFQKVCDYFLFAHSTGQKEDRDIMDEDETAFKLVKDKMVRAYPNRMVSEFKRRLEDKEKLTDIFEVILEMKDQFPEFEYDKDYSGQDLNVLNQKKSDWKKNVRCFKCNKKGHLKKDCYSKRESKTKKSGSKN